MRRTIYAVLLCAFLFSCREEPLPKAFIIPPEATALEKLTFRGMNQLSYRVSISYPAMSVIEKIVREVQQQGWAPLNEKFLQPGVATSQKTGWTYFEDNRVGGDSFLYEWSCDWKDKHGNILNYTFQYRDRVEKYRRSTYILRPGSSNLKVIAIYMPHEVALRIREEALRKPKPVQTQMR